MLSRPFNLSASVQLSGVGYGVVRFQAVAVDTVTVTFVSVSVTTRTAEAKASVYRNYVGAPYLIDYTPSGSTGDTSDTITELHDGDSIIIEWSGGDPGATATATVRGTQDARGSINAI